MRQSNQVDIDLKTLAESQLDRLVPLLADIAGAVALVLLPGPYFQPGRFLVFLLLFAVGATAYYLKVRNLTATRWLLLLGSSLSMALALIWIPSPAVPFFAALGVAISWVLGPLFGLMAAVLNSLAIVLLLAPSLSAVWPALVLAWSVAGACWIISKSLYTVLGWAWSSQRQATLLLEDLRNRQGELNRSIQALTEATERLARLSHELAEARVAAEEALEFKERFAANISHELRTPLNIIIGFSEIMHLTPDVYGDIRWPDTLRRDVRQIYQSSKQLLSLVNDVLDLSRIDAGEAALQKEKADLRSIIQEAVDTVEGLAQGQGIALNAELPAHIPPLVMDRARIRQVLLNLLSNAIRFTEHGFVRVTAQAAPQEVVVAVQDTGIGLRQEELERIFDEFHQIDMSLRRRKEGAGLGLAISKRFVELHGGRIWAESQPGTGSIFYFSLPNQVSIIPAKLVRTRTIIVSGKGSPPILVIDPDPAVTALLSRHLDGYTFVAVDNAAHAVGPIADLRPRAVVLNVPASQTLQAELERTTRNYLPDWIPLVTVSIPSQSWLSYNANVDGVLTKPFTRDELGSWLQRLDGVHSILILDDDRGFVQLLVRYLTGLRAGLEIRWAYDAEEALESVHAAQPDLLILDLALPDKNGLDFLRELRSFPQYAFIRVLIATAMDYGRDLAEKEGFHLSVSRRLPLATSQIIKYLESALAATEPSFPQDSAPARPAIASG